MKKKFWIVLILAAALLCGALVLVFTGSYDLSTGRCLLANNGSILLIDENSPIQLSGVNEKTKNKLTTGDRILVLHDGIQETYPAKTRAYLVLKLGSGSLADIPAQVQQELTDMGWLGEQKVELPPAQEMTAYETVSYTFGYADMQLSIPEGWQYSIRQYDPEQYGFGIDFWPEGVGEGKLSLNYYDQFGVCGTGLEEKTVQISGMEGWMGTYDGAAVWDFISLQGLPGSYVFQTANADAWYADYEGQIAGILESALLAQNVIWEAEALAIGAQALEKDPEQLRARFDGSTGLWTVESVHESGDLQVTVDSDGDVYYEICTLPLAQ